MVVNMCTWVMYFTNIYALIVRHSDKCTIGRMTFVKEPRFGRIQCKCERIPGVLLNNQTNMDFLIFEADFGCDSETAEQRE